MSLRDRIRDTQDWTADVLDVPEWHEKVEVRSLSLAAVDAIQKGHPGKGDELVAPDLDISVDLVIAATHDPEGGERLFAAEDAPWLMEKNAAVISRLATKVMELSALDGKATDRAGKG